MDRLVFESHPYYGNRFDMSWEEEHVCLLCDGHGCRACDDLPPTAVKIPVRIEPPERVKKYWEIEEEQFRERKAQAIKAELPWITSLIQKDWGRP